MLQELHITNFAIISEVRIAFSDGFTVLTGETGAGKSIIVDAVSMLLGGRASSEIIRSGAQSASIEAVFDISGIKDLKSLLDDSGIEAESELIAKRVISSEGKNRQFINGSAVTLSMLASITGRLINIYGQHESQSLLKTDNHLELLDSFCCHSEELSNYRVLFDRLKSADSEIERIRKGMMDAARRFDLLSFQQKEISDAELVDGEIEELEHEKEILLHSEILSTAAYNGYEKIYGADNSLLGDLGSVLSRLTEAAAFDNSLSPVIETLNSGYAGLEDAAMTLRSYSEKLEHDPQRLSDVDDRLNLIRKLQKKYGESIKDILEYKAQIEKELDELQHTDETLELLETGRIEIYESLKQAGALLSEKREAGAASFSSKLSSELSELSMPEARVTVSFRKFTDPASDGFETAEFLLASNSGEPARSLSKIASGGELSRLMLAIKQVLPENDVPTLVFDEVDAGIGGEAAASVGRKLKNVSTLQQVLCITHLAQIASFADSHLKVEKRQSDGRTTSSVNMLSHPERVTEISRMLDGAGMTETSLAHAAELLNRKGDN